jgi:hypothetical protein
MDFLKLRRCLFPGLRKQMLIYVERDWGARMPHLVADVFRALTLSGRHKGKPIVQTSQAKVGQTRANVSLRVAQQNQQASWRMLAAVV